ncbi:MAG: CoA transferase [Vannielia sp.]|uniref:CaiB/BaiF CoA transferase family protein n=1 Tax=Rhodobacterales TaxID=204455 RepID=UPI00209657C2|nr:CoA transferase [Oceanicola sp. 502str15]MCO6383439.1 CoA transferase [Oceanicola sp. 502str15]
MKPLEGVRVLDFTHALSGPLCTYHLALQGADVVKVERPGNGDDLRLYTEHTGPQGFSGPFVAANAAKRSVALDLKSNEGREAVRRLAARSDVVIENFRPGVAARLGVDYDSLLEENPNLIYCAISGFGATGPMREWPAYDHIVQAMSGIMWVNGEPDQGPLKVGLPFADTISGYVAAFSIVNALFQRQRDGGPQFIDVGMLDATLMLLSQAIAVADMSGELPIRTGNRGYRLVATADTYATADGHIAIGANHQHQFEKLCEVLGIADIAGDPRFATHQARVENNDELRAVLVEFFGRQKASELEDKLASQQVPAAMVRNVIEAVGMPHSQERNLFVDTRVPGIDRALKLTGAGFRFGHDGALTEAQVPSVGEHTQEVLAEIGLA